MRGRGSFYLTDGVLQRMLLSDSELKGVGAVIFDEFHERRLASDLALGRVLDLQESVREDLKVVVMSATLEMGGLKGFLEPCEMVEAGGADVSGGGGAEGGGDGVARRGWTEGVVGSGGGGGADRGGEFGGG